MYNYGSIGNASLEWKLKSVVSTYGEEGKWIIFVITYGCCWFQRSNSYLHHYHDTIVSRTFLSVSQHYEICSSGRFKWDLFTRTNAILVQTLYRHPRLPSRRRSVWSLTKALLHSSIFPSLPCCFHVIAQTKKLQTRNYFNFAEANSPFSSSHDWWTGGAATSASPSCHDTDQSWTDHGCVNTWGNKQPVWEHLLGKHYL